MVERKESKKYLDEFRGYVVMDPYPFVVDVRKSLGMWLATVDGDRIFDWGGYYGSKLISHNHPGLYESSYLESLIAVANNKLANPDFLSPECVAYYRTLREIAPGTMNNDRLEIYAINSGAEAVENLLKYFINLYDAKCLEKAVAPTRRRFIYFEQAFHGRTVYALNITRLKHAPMVTKDFQGIIENIEIPFPAINTDSPEAVNKQSLERSLELLENALRLYGDEIVGIIVEPIQGAGGHRLAYPEFFQRISSLAHDYQVYLGFDEVQTAGGQVGEVFATDLFNLPHPPQGIATGKKLGCGVVYMLHPMTDLGILDSTWGGGLTDMVRFCQEWKIVTGEKLLEQVGPKAESLVRGLKLLQSKYPQTINNIRGMGLYQGFSLQSESQRDRLVDRALDEENLLILGAGADSIRLRPVLDLSHEDIELFLKKLDRVLEFI